MAVLLFQIKRKPGGKTAGNYIIVYTWLLLPQNHGTVDVDGLVWILIPDVPVWQ